MNKIVECVPNFSEGRNTKTIEAIAHAIRETIGCRLLDVDPGRSTNRTVYTFVGAPEAVVQGALNAATVAKDLIDMSIHQGEHHRMGAMDVCPFIPVANVTMEECVTISKEFGRRAGEELGIPIYLYEESSDRDYRKKLPQIREGQYEGLKDRITTEKWKPDFGPAQFIPAWGAKAMETGIWGAWRNVMINMADITDPVYKKKTLSDAENLKNKAADQCRRVLDILESRAPNK